MLGLRLVLVLRQVLGSLGHRGHLGDLYLLAVHGHQALHLHPEKLRGHDNVVYSLNRTPGINDTRCQSTVFDPHARVSLVQYWVNFEHQYHILQYAFNIYIQWCKIVTLKKFPLYSVNNGMMKFEVLRKKFLNAQNSRFILRY